MVFAFFIALFAGAAILAIGGFIFGFIYTLPNASENAKRVFWGGAAALLALYWINSHWAYASTKSEGEKNIAVHSFYRFQSELKRSAYDACFDAAKGARVVTEIKYGPRCTKELISSGLMGAIIDERSKLMREHPDVSYEVDVQKLATQMMEKRGY